MAIHDDAIAAYLGAIRLTSHYLDSKNNHHGTLVGSPTWIYDATIARHYLNIATPFTDYANVAFTSNPTPQSLSVHAWARLYWVDGSTQASILVTTSTSVAPHSSGGLYIVAGSMSESGFSLGIRSAGAGGYVYHTATYPYNTWIATGAYYNHLTQRIGLYVNGASVVDAPVSSAPVITNLLVARGGNNSTLTRKVDTADVSLWDRILSPAEFATLAKPSYRPLATGSVVTPHLIAPSLSYGVIG